MVWQDNTAICRCRAGLKHIQSRAVMKEDGGLSMPLRKEMSDPLTSDEILAKINNGKGSGP